MKIAFLLTDFPAYSQTFILTQIKGIIEAGHTVKIYANNNPEQNILQPIYEEYHLKKFTTYYLNPNQVPADNPHSLTSLLRTEYKNINLFHCHFLPTLEWLWESKALLNFNTPIITTCYGVDVMPLRSYGKLSYFNQTDLKFIAISDSIKKQLLYLGIDPQRIWIKPLSTDTSFFKPTSTVEERKGFVCISRFVEKKGILDSIKAFDKLDDTEATYDIYGEGPQKNDIEKLIAKLDLSKKITLHEPVNHKNIVQILNKHKYFIHTSKTALSGDAEGQAVAIQEAQACGIPVITTNHDGIPEGVLDNKTGYLSKEGDIDHLASNLARAISLSNRTYADMSTNAAKFVRSKYQPKKIMKDLLSFYDNVRLNQEIINNMEYSETLEANPNLSRNKKTMLVFSHTAGLGGSERSLLEMLIELQDLGTHTHTIIPENGPLEEKLRQHNLDYSIINYSWWCTANHIDKESLYLRYRESIMQLFANISPIRRIDPDLIFTNTLTIPWGIYIAEYLGIPHIWFIREYGEMDHNLKFLFGFKKSIQFISNHSDFIYTNSKATYKYFRKLIDSPRIAYSYAFIDIMKSLLLETPIAKFDIHEALRLIISGAIKKGKGQLEAAIAVCSLIEQNFNIELIILGSQLDKEYLQKIKATIKKCKKKNSIKIINNVTNPYPIMQQADIVLMCSDNEAYGRTTVEAMCLKKPVIATTNGATPELIKHKYNGLLYKAKDLLTLEKHIKYFSQNKQEISRMGQNGYKRYLRLITKEKYGHTINRRIKKIIRQKDTQPNVNKLHYELIADYCAENKNILMKYQELLNVNKDLNLLLENIKNAKFFKVWQSINSLKKVFTK